MRIYVYDIDWDTDGEEVEDLPEEVQMVVPEGEDVEDFAINEVADRLSDDYGWCINSFEWEEAE